MATQELLSILVPVFNEARTVASVIDRLRSIHLPVPREIVVVNDGSSDGTREVLDAEPGQGDGLRILHVEQTRARARPSASASSTPAGRSSRSRTRTSNSTRPSWPPS